MQKAKIKYFISNTLWQNGLYFRPRRAFYFPRIIKKPHPFSYYQSFTNLRCTKHLAESASTFLTVFWPWKLFIRESWCSYLSKPTTEVTGWNAYCRMKQNDQRDTVRFFSFLRQSLFLKSVGMEAVPRLILFWGSRTSRSWGHNAEIHIYDLCSKSKNISKRENFPLS